MISKSTESAGLQSFGEWFSQSITDEIFSQLFKHEVSSLSSSPNTSTKSGQDQGLCSGQTSRSAVTAAL